MKGKIIAITIICAIDAFLIGFAVGFNSKHAVIEDPSLTPVDVESLKQDKSLLDKIL